MSAMFRHVPLGDVGSTNDEARMRLFDLESGPYVVTGVRQLAGRGRRGREWTSPAGNLYASFTFRPDAPLARLPELSFVAALAVCDMARSLTGRDNICCKWPNDVLAGDAKICGILLETAGSPDQPLAVIIGIGVNVASYPEGTPYPATCLLDLGFGGDVPAVCDELGECLDRWIGKWLAGGFDVIRAAWLERVRGLGEPLIARLPDRQIEGVFAGLDEHGALMLEMADGDVLRIAAADVFRPGLVKQDDRDASRD